MDDFFDNIDVDLRDQALLVASQFRGCIVYWWENLLKQRELEGKKRIKSWYKMREELKQNYMT